MELSYMPLDYAYSNTYLGDKYDQENEYELCSSGSYENIMHESNKLKAQGKIPLNEQTSNMPPQCGNSMVHIQKCSHCQQKLKMLIYMQVQQNGAGKSSNSLFSSFQAPKLPGNFFQSMSRSDAIFMTIFAVTIIVALTLFFDFSITVSNKGKNKSS